MATKRKSKRISEEEELETAYRQVSGYKGKYKKDRIHSRIPIIIAICIALAAIVFCIVAGYRYFI
jgi:hypothetical protein